MVIEPPDHWTDKDDQFIKENWQDMADHELAEQLNVAAGLIVTKRLQNGWYKSENEELLRQRLSPRDRPSTDKQPEE